MTNTQLAQDLKQFKIENKLTYAELGNMIGTSQHISYDLCNCRRVFIPFEVAKKIIGLISKEA